MNGPAGQQRCAAVAPLSGSGERGALCFGLASSRFPEGLRDSAVSGPVPDVPDVTALLGK